MATTVLARTLGLLIILIALTTIQPAFSDGGNHEKSLQKTWIYFVDHGERSHAELTQAIETVRLSERSLERRRTRGAGPVVDVHDVPVCRDYLDSVRETGCVLKRTSRYLNAISVIATPEQLTRIRQLPFVTKIVPVRRYRRNPHVDSGLDTGREPHINQNAPLRSTAAENYGPSEQQLAQINVIQMHESGYHGEGVMIGVFDTGFNRSHVALQNVDVEAEWDFIFDDGNTRNEAVDSPTQHNHGTQVLSAVGAYAPGHLIGSAWEATYVLAKTERVFEEVEGEEDDFVRALEWVDSIGVDIVSSSLGYYDWYTASDLDGNTCVTTIACDIAASKGITICTAAGNERATTWGTLIAPADADSVITVGAVDQSGAVASFSSPGPTDDGRIKPDVSARGVSTTLVAYWDSTAYTTGSGTSFSTPLVAGACALVLQMHPDWGPMDVLNALRDEASNSATPDNDIGWGIIDTYRSALGTQIGVLDAVSVTLELSGDLVTTTVFNGNSDGITVDVERRRKGNEPSGWEPVTEVALDVFVPGSSSVNVDDRVKQSGLYQYRLLLTIDDTLYMTSWEDNTVKIAYLVTLGQSRPNPFEPRLSGDVAIPYTVGGVPPDHDAEAPISSYNDVSLEIFDVRGARVATLVDGIDYPRDFTARWNGRNHKGDPAPSGVYFYRLTVGGQALVRKLVLIR